MRLATVTVLTLILAGIAAGIAAQSPTPPLFKRTVLQQMDISTPGREAVMAVVDFQPGGNPGRHTHPGEEIGYILEGTFTFEVAGKPPVTLTAGQPFFVPAGAIHNATSKGTGRILANYIVEKGKPLATPAPAK